MAKTRANAQSSKPSTKFDAGLAANKVEKKSIKMVRGGKIPPIAAKLQSKNEKEKNANIKATEELLKLCRPISIILTRIIPEKTIQIPDVDRKFSFFIFFTHIFVFVKSKTFKKNLNLCSVTQALIIPVPAIRAPATRAKKEGIKANEQSKKAVQKSNRTSNMPTLQQFIEAAYKKELNIFHESRKQLSVGDAVIARMRGFLPWPGRIQSIGPNNNTIYCYFFGTHDSGPVGSKNIIPFHGARETIRLVALRSPKKYVKGVKEVEVEYGVPEEMSCLNELKSIN